MVDGGRTLWASAAGGQRPPVGQRALVGQRLFRFLTRPFTQLLDARKARLVVPPVELVPDSIGEIIGALLNLPPVTICGLSGIHLFSEPLHLARSVNDPGDSPGLHEDLDHVTKIKQLAPHERQTKGSICQDDASRKRKSMMQTHERQWWRPISPSRWRDAEERSWRRIKGGVELLKYEHIVAQIVDEPVTAPTMRSSETELQDQEPRHRTGVPWRRGASILWSDGERYPQFVWSWSPLRAAPALGRRSRVAQFERSRVFTRSGSSRIEVNRSRRA